MRDLLLTSSVLIAALLLLRKLVRARLSRRIQYALWLLVALRLLIPVNLPPSAYSVLSAAAPLRATVERRLDSPAAVRRESSRQESSLAASPPEAAPTAEAAQRPAAPPPPRPSPETAARGVWYGGMVCMASFFLWENLRLRRRLRRARTPYDTSADLPVYLVGEGILPSPCLFGFPRPAIYLTPAALSSRETLRHVLLHEQTHARHLDPLWSLLRCVCLSVYWFDPLVWAAALASKTDCELACDEGVLARLEPEERLSYGETLLSLVPRQRSAAHPLLAATTMTDGKRQLRERISRIACRPKRFAAGTLAVLVLTGSLAACTFTGGQSAEPLSPEELRWFNESFFNDSAPAPDATPGSSTIRNQFANPINLYERPEEIDLYELFYLEKDSIPPQELLSRGVAMPSEDAPCPTYWLRTSTMNEILQTYTGLTLPETRQTGLDHFTYLESLDAYSWSHGDTNYCGRLDFLCGTKETDADGELVKLYHRSTSFDSQHWYCVTLSVPEAETIHFRSNLECAPPRIPAVLPENPPAETIPLNGLQPYTPPAEPPQLYPAGDLPSDYRNRLENWDFDGHNVQVYRGPDSVIRAAVVLEDGAPLVFLSDLNEDCSVFFFNGLFGRSGFFVRYQPPGGDPTFDFYRFAKDGSPVLLARCHASTDTARLLDLDGDGTDELVCGRQLFFQREGTLYCAELDVLLADADPRLADCTGAVWDPYGRTCRITGSKGGSSWTRQIFFDGAQLLSFR